MQKALFIVLEGPDRSGKSTQALLLKSWLKSLGRDTILTREPGGTALGEAVRKLLLRPKLKILPKAELFLLAAARSEHIAEIIKPALSEGKIIISDRFSMSSQAYQGYGSGLDMEKINAVNAFATENLQPNLTIVFEMSALEFSRRAHIREKENKDRFERKDAQFREKVRLGYLALSKGPGIERVNANKSIDALQAELRGLISRML